MILTADDVIINTKSSLVMQQWLDSCIDWANRERIKWKSKKFMVVCNSMEERDNIEPGLTIIEREITKKTDAVYVDMMITSEGLKATNNIARSLEAIKQTLGIATMARLGTNKQWNRTLFVSGTYLRSSYLYNEFIVEAIPQIQAADS